MNLLRSLAAAFSTFSRIPVPSASLQEKDFKYTLCFFPAVGVVIALLEWCVWELCARACLGDLFRTCVMCAVPIIVTGGIHLDGFCDTSDAASSYQSAEKKLDILKDPHIGAFGVIRLVLLTLLYVGAVSEIENVYLFGITFVMSRALTAFSVVSLKPAKKTGMGAAEKNNSNKKAVIVSSIVWVLLCIGAAFLCAQTQVDIRCVQKTSVMAGVVTASCMLASAVTMYFFYRRKVYKNFGGFTGDTSGWFLCVLELLMAYVVVAVGIFTSTLFI